MRLYARGRHLSNAQGTTKQLTQLSVRGEKNVGYKEEDWFQISDL